MSDAQPVDDTPPAAPTPSEPPPKKPSGRPVALRIWPAVALLVLMWLLRLSGSFNDEPSLPLMMLQFMGPAAVGMLIIAWWVFFSRAQWKERLAGAAGVVLIAVATTMLQDKTMQGMGTILFAIPWGLTAFALGAVVMRNQFDRRTLAALVAALVGFGYWTLVRTDAIHGDFRTVNRWRWVPTPEDRFLESLDAMPKADSSAHSNLSATVADPEWPEFRRDRRGRVADLVLDEDWSAHPPKELWRTKVGPGWSSFTVAGDRIFTQEQRGDKEAVVCYNAANGKQVWIYEDETRFWETIAGAGPRGTPTIAQGALFALGANGILNRLDPVSGEAVWKQDLRKDADREPPTWGFSSSPLVTGGLVIVHAGGAGANGVLAYDAESGDIQWSARAGDHSYSSPQLSTVDGKECVLMLSNDGLIMLDPKDGAVLAEHAFPFQDGYRVIQPMVLDQSRILLGTPMGPGTQCVEAKWDGSEFQIDEVWLTKRMNPYYNDFVELDGFLYGFDNRIFACIDLKDGKRAWKRGRYGHGQVLLLPKQKQLLIISEDGELVLLSADPKKHIELARFQALESRTWNHPVLVGNRLFVRNAEEAACFELKLAESNVPPAGDSEEQ